MPACLISTTACAAALTLTAPAGDPPPDAVADSKAVIVVGKARSTVLTPGLIRMEWSPDGKFEDRPSQVVINRRLPVPAFETGDGEYVRQVFGGPPIAHARAEEMFYLKTERIALACRDDGRPFSRDNLLIRTPMPGPGWGETWQLAPPLAPRGNLGGTTRPLDGVSGACRIGDGRIRDPSTGTSSHMAATTKGRWAISPGSPGGFRCRRGSYSGLGGRVAGPTVPGS